MELGSEYNLSLQELNITEDNLFSFIQTYNYHLVNSGRNALKILSLSSGEILLPDYICESVIGCFDKDKVSFYKTDDTCRIDVSDLLSKIKINTKLIYIVHYFGTVQPCSALQTIRKISKERGITLVEDTTQSLFSGNFKGADYYVASLRKWFPVPMGGIIYSKQTISFKAFQKSTDNRRTYGAVLKDLFLNNEFDCNLEYRKIFSECENEIDKEKPMVISDFARFIISCISIRDLIYKRQKNYQQLLMGLSLINIKPVIELQANDCPFVFPIRVPDRDRFRQYLMDNKIYCAVHWPFDGFRKEQRLQAVKNADTMLSLPVDQRYNKNHMDYLLDVISKYKGELLF